MRWQVVFFGSLGMVLFAGAPGKASQGSGWRVHWVSQVVVLSSPAEPGVGWSPALLMPGRVVQVTRGELETVVSRSQRSGSATVEVVGALEDAEAVRMYSFVTTLKPALARAFRMGEGAPYTGQMLAEFMSMHGSDFRPPTVPSVFYNCMIPSELKNSGWVYSGSGASISISASPNPRNHVAMYPKR